MGRKKKYVTEQEKYEAELKWKREWYKRNSERVKKQRMDDYWRGKEVDANMS